MFNDQENTKPALAKHSAFLIEDSNIEQYVNQRNMTNIYNLSFFRSIHPPLFKSIHPGKAKMIHPHLTYSQHPKYSYSKSQVI